MPKPTVGRIVLYRSYGTPNGEYDSEDRAAIITSVETDEKVTLAVFNPSGMFFNACEYSEEPKGGTWRWPTITPVMQGVQPGTNICRSCGLRKEMFQDESICADCLRKARKDPVE